MVKRFLLVIKSRSFAVCLMVMVGAGLLTTHLYSVQPSRSPAPAPDAAQESHSTTPRPSGGTSPTDAKLVTESDSSVNGRQMTSTTTQGSPPIVVATTTSASAPPLTSATNVTPPVSTPTETTQPTSPTDSTAPTDPSGVPNAGQNDGSQG